GCFAGWGIDCSVCLSRQSSDDNTYGSYPSTREFLSAVPPHRWIAASSTADTVRYSQRFRGTVPASPTLQHPLNSPFSSSSQQANQAYRTKSRQAVSAIRY